VSEHWVCQGCGGLRSPQVTSCYRCGTERPLGARPAESGRKRVAAGGMRQAVGVGCGVVAVVAVILAAAGISSLAHGLGDTLSAGDWAKVWAVLIPVGIVGILASWLIGTRRRVPREMPTPLCDELIACPSCGQRTAPGAECQWCDEALGGEG
jgi:hypothetical protein